MPKSRVSRKKLFREFSKIDPKFIQRNDLKYITFLYRDMKDNFGLNTTEVEILLFAYDLEFWTIDHLAEAMMRSSAQLKKKNIYKMVKEDLIYPHFNKLTPQNSELSAQFFREENKFNYRIRYALTQKARLLVARMYRKLYGEEPFRVFSLSAEQE
jgi:DNA-binding MarR family transcriptional regulator